MTVPTTPAPPTAPNPKPPMIPNLALDPEGPLA